MNTPGQLLALQRIRQKLYFCAGLALKNNLDLSADLHRIFGFCESIDSQSMVDTKAESKTIFDRTKLEPRERLVLETICESSEPVSIDEMLDKFKDNKDTRCSKATLTTVIKVLKRLDLISYTVVESGKTGYVKRNHAITKFEKVCRKRNAQ